MIHTFDNINIQQFPYSKFYINKVLMYSKTICIYSIIMVFGNGFGKKGEKTDFISGWIFPKQLAGLDRREDRGGGKLTLISWEYPSLEYWEQPAKNCGYF